MVNNTGNEELGKWLEHVKSIDPIKVMIYSIDRDTPAENLVKVEKDELELIAKKVRFLNIECEIA